jgi:hypothetical protein
VKTLTIKQPWASLIATGLKDVENRSWKTSYRGPLLIHAGAAYDKPGARKAAEILDIHSDSLLDTPQSAIIAIVDIIDCVRNYPSPWSCPEEYQWVLANPVTLDEPIARKGKLGLWTPDDGVLAQLDILTGALA